MLSDAEIQAFVNAPRNPSWYVRHYTDLHNVIFPTMLHGVRYDLAAAVTKKVEVLANKERCKVDILKLTDGVKLWSEESHLTDEVNALLETVRNIKAEYDAIPKTDRGSRKAFKPTLDAAKAAVAECRAAGRDKWIEVGTGLSDQKIAAYLYGTLGVPAYKKKRKESGKITATVDDITLKKIRMKYPQLTPLIKVILDHRKCNKLLSYLDESKIDPDGRIRCTYKTTGTQNARVASSETPRSTGTNLQNFDRSLKSLLIPDEG